MRLLLTAQSHGMIVVKVYNLGELVTFEGSDYIQLAYEYGDLKV